MLDSIGQIPAEAARRFGDKIALITPGRELSFNELNALSNRCANALVSLGVKTGDRVTLSSGFLNPMKCLLAQSLRKSESC
jgi:long-chain acyl-CoA synthetase